MFCCALANESIDFCERGGDEKVTCRDPPSNTEGAAGAVPLPSAFAEQKAPGTGAGSWPRPAAPGWKHSGCCRWVHVLPCSDLRITAPEADHTWSPTSPAHPQCSRVTHSKKQRVGSEPAQPHQCIRNRADKPLQTPVFLHVNSARGAGCRWRCLLVTAAVEQLNPTCRGVYYRWCERSRSLEQGSRLGVLLVSAYEAGSDTNTRLVPESRGTQHPNRWNALWAMS